MTPERENEARAEAERLAELPIADQLQIIDLHRSIVNDANVPIHERDLARERADALERHLKRLNRIKKKKTFVERPLEQMLFDCVFALVGKNGFQHGAKTMGAIIGYLRVSTKGQGESGLGLEAQRSAVEAYARQSDASITQWYTEVESGKLADRPELLKALAHARRSKATLVVAKLDRLARNVAFLSALMDSKVPFVACDNPHANRLTLHILAAVAEAEAVAISQRTKAALTAYRARGGKLGAELVQCRNLTPEAVAKGRERSVESRSKAATEAYADLLPDIQSLRNNGKTLQAIADELNLQGHTTRRGKPWNQMQVARVLERAE